MADLMPGAHPFFFRGGPVGALLIHGFTSTPNEMRPLGEALAAEGCTALGVRLTHHGTSPSDMNRSHWRDWFTAALDGYYILRDQCRAVYVMGLSMGGALALRIAAHYPVAGVVAMSTPSMPLHDKMAWPSHFAAPLSYLIPYVPKRRLAPEPGPGQAVSPDGKHVTYPVYPVRAVPQLRALLRDVAASLAQITCPVLLVHSRGDRGVPQENMVYMFERLGAADKEMLWLEKSGHIVTEDCECRQLFERVRAFVRDHQPQVRA